MVDDGNFREVSFTALLFSPAHVWGRAGRGYPRRGPRPSPRQGRSCAPASPPPPPRTDLPKYFYRLYSRYFLVSAGDLCVCGGSSTRRRPPAAGLRRRGLRGGSRGCPRLRAPAPAAWRAGRSSPGPGALAISTPGPNIVQHVQQEVIANYHYHHFHHHHHEGRW